MAHIIVTRPDQDARATAARLVHLGHEAVVAPLMDVQTAPGPPLDLDGVQALLLTSANGARAFAERQEGKVPELPVLCVGDATARAAEGAGLTHVQSAGGDVDDLARLAATCLSPDEGVVLHVAGSKVAGDLAGMLADHGFAYRRDVLYGARPVKSLPEPAHHAVAAGRADGVFFYSPRTAALFRDLVISAGLENGLARLTAYCLSTNVAAECGSGWGQVLTAEAPTEDRLFDLLPKAESPL